MKKADMKKQMKDLQNRYEQTRREAETYAALDKAIRQLQAFANQYDSRIQRAFLNNNVNMAKAFCAAKARWKFMADKIAEAKDNIQFRSCSDAMLTAINPVAQYLEAANANSGTMVDFDKLNKALLKSAEIMQQTMIAVPNFVDQMTGALQGAILPGVDDGSTVGELSPAAQAEYDDQWAIFKQTQAGASTIETVADEKTDVTDIDKMVDALRNGKK